MKLLCVLLIILIAFEAAENVSCKAYPSKQFVNKRRLNNVKDKASEPLEKYVTYYFYSPLSQNVPFVVRNSEASELSKTPYFDPKRKVIFLIHGWVDNCTGNLNTFVKPAIFAKQDVNLIVVDWSPIAEGHYVYAQSSVKAVGQFIGNFLNDYMDTYEVSSRNIVLIGHSLGAHVSGNAGKNTKTKLAQIIALDPAGPGFSLTSSEDRLDSSDAHYVQAIHTNMAFWGFSRSIGHADYYPNGGYSQNGCGIDALGACSHIRSINFLAEAIDGGQFVARKCSNYLGYIIGMCNNNEKSLMGQLEVDHQVIGDYYLTTNEDAPFAQG